MALRLLTKQFCLFAFSLLLPVGAQAAACCGGGFALPALITGDDLAQATASFSYSEVSKDVGSDSLWRKRDSREQSETLKLEGAHIFWDRWQAGATLPIIRRGRSGQASTGLGDLSATLGYEILPEWEYNPWRPRGITFLQLTTPTGRSINESNVTYQLDSRGRGFWALGIGAIFTKTYDMLDLYFTTEAHRSFAKNFQNGLSSGRLRPGLGGNVGVGAGYSLGDLRFGLGISWAYEQGIDVSGAVSSKGIPQRYATGTASASYLFSPAWATTLTYSDQTLFSRPLNTSLGRGGSLLVQRKWAR